MITSTKTILKIFSQTALLRANEILSSSKNVEDLVDTATKEINSGKRKVISFRDDVALLLSMLRAWAKGEYKEVPWTTLVLTTGSIIYFVNPFDALPDMIPAAGLLDDATVIGFIIASIKQDVSKFKKQYLSYSDNLEHAPI